MKTNHWWSQACNYDGWRSRWRGAWGDTLSILRGDYSDGGNPCRPWGHGPWQRVRNLWKSDAVIMLGCVLLFIIYTSPVWLTLWVVTHFVLKYW